MLKLCMREVLHHRTEMHENRSEWTSVRDVCRRTPASLTHTHTHMHTCTRAHTHTHTHTRTHTHTHTHTKTNKSRDRWQCIWHSLCSPVLKHIVSTNSGMTQTYFLISYCSIFDYDFFCMFAVVYIIQPPNHIQSNLYTPIMNHINMLFYISCSFILVSLRYEIILVCYSIILIQNIVVNMCLW